MSEVLGGGQQAFSEFIYRNYFVRHLEAFYRSKQGTKSARLVAPFNPECLAPFTPEYSALASQK